MIDSVKHKRNSEFHWISNLRLKVFLKIYFWSFKERNVFSYFALTVTKANYTLPTLTQSNFPGSTPGPSHPQGVHTSRALRLFPDSL